MPMIDLAPAAHTMSSLVTAIPDDRLTAPTPCPDYTLGDLLHHVGGLTVAFRMAAEKSPDALASSQGPSGDASRLGANWRTRIPSDLDALVEAWRDPQAWEGMTRAGGVDLPGEVGGVVALNELVLHGWDVAMASGQAFDGDEASLEVCHDFVAQFSGPGSEEDRGDAFGPVLAVPAGAPLVDRLLGLSGRDPPPWSSEPPAV